MAKLRFLWDEKAMLGTWSAAEADPDYPASNLGHPHRARKAKTGGSSTSQWFKVDLGAARAIGAFALLDHDFDYSESSVYLEANSTDSWASPAFSLEITPRSGHFIEFFNSVSFRYWRLKFTTANATDVRSAGRMMLGTFYECDRNPAREGLKKGYANATRSRTTQGGQSYHDRAALLKTLKADFQNISAAQVAEFVSMVEAVGSWRPILVSFNHDTEPVAGLLYGRLVKASGPENPDTAEAGYRWRFELEIVEEM